MKKMVSAAAAVLLSATAFAEITVGMNARFRPALVHYKDTLQTANSAAVKETVFLDFKDYSSASDEFSVSASGRNAGIKFVAAYTNDFSYKYWETSEGTEYVAKGPGVETYYGWLQFGNLKVSAGNFGSTLTVPKYNYTMLQAGLTDSYTANWGLGYLAYLRHNDKIYYEGEVGSRTVKASSTYEQTLTTNRITFLYGFNDLTSMEAKRQVSMLAEYTVPNVIGGALLFRAAAFANNFGYTDSYVVSFDSQGRYMFVTNPNANDERIGAGFSAEIAHKSQAATLDLVFKMPSRDAFGFGAYVDVKAVEKLTLAAGFTWGFQDEVLSDSDGGKNTTNTAKVTAAFTAWAADLRLFYRFSRNFLVGTQCKFSCLQEKEIGTTTAFLFDYGDSDNPELAFESVVTAQYNVNSRIAVQFDAGFYLRDLDDNDGLSACENYVTLRPGIQFAAGNRAKVSVAGLVTAALSGDENDTKTVKFNNAPVNLLVQVPVVFRVTL